MQNVSLDIVAKKFNDLLLAEENKLNIQRLGNKTVLSNSEKSVTIFTARNNLVRNNIAINK